jgi:phosphotransferase system HPr (HPr) family protein
MSTAEETTTTTATDGARLASRQEVTVVVRNPQGIHMRPASAFAKAAQKFQSNITVRKPGRCVNGKSPLSMMTLVAMPGTELVIEVDGIDACEAIGVLAEILGADSADIIP